MPDLRITRAEARVYRAPLDSPVQTSFGIMRDRPMVLVLLEADDGTPGLGEIWCNFPAVGAEHRARLFDSVLAPALMERGWAGPQAASQALAERVAVLAIQSGEPGPFANVLAGIDTALWDIAARQAGRPLWRHLAEAPGAGQVDVPVYASGLNPTGPETLAAARAAEGYTAFKLKIGFGAERDCANLDALRDTLGDSARLMVDANQAWSPEAAQAALDWLAPRAPDWLEEPLRADSPAGDWAALAAASPIPLAAGENFTSAAQFAEAARGDVLAVIQPDLAKWGGPARCLEAGRQALAGGKRYCPHYLGGGVGLIASAHVLAAAGGDGMLEIDANPNPLRGILFDHLPLVGGRVTLPDAPGLGLDPAVLDWVEGFAVAH
ncbi:mandelate racemase [Rhodobacteraceae bacterium WD3A24]|nr:mandelate racemase [Rhodobacteraceae bacterium WD3A24]